VRNKLNYIAFVLGLIWFAVMSLLNSYTDPFLGSFFNIFFAGLIGLIASKYFKNTLQVFLLFPLMLIAFSLAIIGNISASYIPLIIFISFQISRYLWNKKWSFGLVILIISGVGFLFSRGILPKYYLFLQDTTKEGEEILDFKYTTNNGSVVCVPSEKPIILEFWNSSCSSCFKKMYMLEELEKDLGDKCDILCVYVDYKKGVEEHYPKYEKSLKRIAGMYNLNFAYDSLYYHYNTERGLPQTIILSPEGKLLYSDVGYIKGNKKAIFDKYKSVLKEHTN
jgi:thiol-disulfide isomerase/thioredoxin